ncbi:hypothetical protein JCGZ_20414 [Jatropha curcas]|uniref:Uncharacterized protein n=1 Tax=Jatropha curcas TaxID=180498 RepID=A0A067JR38_JATCU|nr:hypothetical protein JCGZ_20414 [Jatropha curcas]
MNHAKPLKANIAQMKKRMMRKVVEIDVRLDYEGEKANPKHEPPKRPGGGNR